MVILNTPTTLWLWLGDRAHHEGSAGVCASRRHHTPPGCLCYHWLCVHGCSACVRSPCWHPSRRTPGLPHPSPSHAGASPRSPSRWRRRRPPGGPSRRRGLRSCSPAHAHVVVAVVVVVITQCSGGARGRKAHLDHLLLLRHVLRIHLRGRASVNAHGVVLQPRDCQRHISHDSNAA